LWTHGILPSTSASNPYYGSYYSNYDPSDYITYNGVGTVSGPAGFNGYIGAGQGFFVLMNDGPATSDSVYFYNFMRDSSYNNTQFYKNTTSTVAAEDLDKHRIWLDVSNEQGAYKQTLIGYAADATMGIDRGFDGAYFNSGSSVSIYSLADATTLAIQGRSLPFNDTDEVPLGFYATASGNFTINLFDYDGLFLNQDIYLKDNVLNLYHNLKNSAYNFSATAGTFNDRFVLVYKQQETLTTQQSAVDATAIVLYKPNADLHINAGTILMKEVKVYDVSGRLLFDKKNINATSTQINLGTTNQVLVLEITTSDAVKIIKNIR
jgi:hypothetical protein